MNTKNIKQYCELVSAALDQNDETESHLTLKTAYENLLDEYIKLVSESVLNAQLLNIGITDYIIIDNKNLYIDTPSIIEPLEKGLNIHVYHRFSADLIGKNMNEGTN